MVVSRTQQAGCITALTAALITATAAIGAQPGPFTALAGSWHGIGNISLADGRQEAIRCRAVNNVSTSGTEFQQTLRCASPSYNFTFQSNVESRGGAVSGTWTESTHNISGQVSGRASGGQIQVTVQGQNFSAALTLAARGNRQTVSIRSNGQADLAGANIDMLRGSAREAETTGSGSE
jgi:hypothetical protein